MHKYNAVNCTSAVNNSTIGGGSARDSTSGRSDSLAANFSVNPRRPPPLIPYKLKCDKEPLNSRLGPPDFYPQTLNCPEETLTRDYLQSGYRETVEGLEEAREISLSQVQTFTKPVVIKCREAIRKCLRAINESRAQKRKAGQVYGVPLSGSSLSKPGVFLEQRSCSEDFKKKWIEGLSQPHKRLCSLADHVPHGYRRKSLFEVLIKNNVPLLRATWYIKVNYLNQIRPSSTGISSGTTDKVQLSCTELWTKDFVEYLQNLLDEFISRSNNPALQSRDRSPQMPYTMSLQKSEPVVIDSEEPSLHFKWWYVVRLLHWHHTEGLLSPSVVIDWVLTQLQEKDVLEILQLLLPIIYGFLESVVLSQTYVRSLAGIAVRFIREPSPGGSDLVDNSRRAYTTSALIEMLRYLILAVPDTFVALDCLPLPPSVMSYASNDGTFASKASERPRHMKENLSEVACIFRSKGLDAQYQSLSLNQVVCTIEKCADNLARTACPSYHVRSTAKAVLALDKALLQGDISGAYGSLFESFCDGAVDQNWIEEVSPWLISSLKWIGTVSATFICSVFLLCEWATCDYRDFRSACPDEKFSGGKDFSQVHIVIRLLKLKLRDMQSRHQQKNSSSAVGTDIAKGIGKHSYFSRTTVRGGCEFRGNSGTISGRHAHSSDIYESPGPLHDIIVCWIDQHEICRGEGLKRLQLLVIELMRSGVFYPHVYIRQLSSSGITDMNGHATDLHRRKRHYQILKNLPSLFIRDILQEARVAEGSQLLEIMRVYSNERRLLLNGLLCRQYKNSPKLNTSMLIKYVHPVSVKDSGPPDNLDQLKTIWSGSSVTPKRAKMDVDIVKTSIAALLRFPNSSMPSDSGQDESQGSIRKPTDNSSNKMEALEGTPGCEDCRKAKRQKLSEERSLYLQGNSCMSDDEDTWWMWKGGPKIFDSSKLDPPPKSSKQVSKGRQKIVRKTQSLAHLAASRMESNQEASTSHVCDNKVSCPHHRTVVDGSIDGMRTMHGDVTSIGKAVKQLQLAEKRTITDWLVAVVKQLVEETENNASKMSQFTRPYVSADDRSSAWWKLGEDDLSAVLYLLDTCGDLVSATKLLLWLLPKVTSNPNPTIHSGRNTITLMKNVENHACEVGEAFLVSSIRRYENVLIATDLIPEVLSAAMHRIVALLASSGRVSGAGLVYSRHLLRKYGHLPSVSEWEKSWKTKCDKRLVPELDCGRSTDGDFGFSLGVPAGVEDVDDFVRQRMSVNRLSRLGVNMRDIVQRNFDDAFQYFYGKDRKVSSTGTPKSPGLDKYEDGYRLAQQIVTGLMECIRQTGGAAQEGDPSLVSSAVSAIVHNIGQSIAKMPEFTGPGNSSNASSAMGSLNFARRILRIHVNCLCLLKEALGERQSRVFEIALAIEASSALAAVFAPGKTSRGQFQLSPEAHDSNPSTDTSNNAAKSPPGRGTKCAAAISALVILAVIHGVSSLERIVTVLRLKEGLGITQYLRSIKSNSNGNNRLVGATKVDTPVEVYVHWFRLLVGNCRTVCDGLVVDFLGEPNVVAFLRMQRILPISLVFPPAYSIFAFVIWRPLIINSNLTTREDVQQLYNSMTMAIGDAIKHLPFRNTCLRDSQGFYDLVAADNSDVEFAALIESNGLDKHFKYMAFVPLRGRLFLNAIIDCKMPQSIFAQDDISRISGHGGSKVQQAESGAKLVDKLVDVLDTLQPAKFHWQWVELRLLLNEQAVIEKLETHDIPLVDAIRSASPGAGNASVSENENNIIEIILTRLLVRPDAAPLFLELVHLLGRSLEDSILMQAKWFLGGLDVLCGRKTIRQRLVNIAESRGVSTKQRFWKPWGWHNSGFDSVKNVGDKKFEVTSLEDGEVNEENSKMKKLGKGSYLIFESEGSSVNLQQVTERALIDLVLPCIDRSSEDSRNTFASELIKQLNTIEQQIGAACRGASKQAGVSTGMETPASKGNSRKGMRGGSPGLAKQRTAAAAEPTMPSPAGLRTSMSLRVQLLLRLLPTICSDGEPSGRNMRHMLAPVILRLLGSQIVHEDEDRFSPIRGFESKRNMEFTSGDGFANLSGESLFDRLLFVLHALLSSCQPSWLKGWPAFKSTNESGCDLEVIESLQTDLDRMQLPGIIRWRIQSAMPNLVPSIRCSISCQPPSIPLAAVTCLQPSISNSTQNIGSQAQRNTVSSTRAATNISGKSKLLSVQQDNDMEIDPWTLLEDGTGSGPSSSNTAVVNNGNAANLHASYWLKGAVRVRRTDLTYIGAVDDDS